MMHSNSPINTETDPSPPDPTIVNNVVASQPTQPATTLGTGGLFSPPLLSYAATANDAGYIATATGATNLFSPPAGSIDTGFFCPISRLSISPSNCSALSGSPHEGGTVFVQVPPQYGQNNSYFHPLAPFMQQPAHNQTTAAPYPNYPVVQVGLTMQDSSGGRTTLSNGGRTTPSNGGRTTPSNGGRTTPSIDDGVRKAVKTGREGREKGALLYLAAEHLILLQSIELVKESFGALESSPEWKEVHKLMVEGYYGKLGSGRSSVTLQSHFAEFYSAFKNGICGLSMLVGAPKCMSNVDVDATEFDNHVANLLEFLLSNKKIPKKCWSFEVAKLLLQLHLKSVKEFGSGVQGASFLDNKKQVTKSKFEMDQKNWETELARKRALEEEERKEAATNHKKVAQQSKRIADYLERMCAPSTQDVSRAIEERLEAHQAQVSASVQQMLGFFLSEIKDRISENHGKLSSSFS